MTYLRSAGPTRSLTDYYPSWLDSLAEDVIIEGWAMDGAAQSGGRPDNPGRHPHAV